MKWVERRRKRKRSRAKRRGKLGGRKERVTRKG